MHSGSPSGNTMSERSLPVKVLYCSAEYCEFGPDFTRCKPWLIDNAPDLYPGVVKEAAERAAEQIEGLELAPRKRETISGTGSSADGKPAEEVKKLPGGKVKKKEKAEVVVEKVVRNKRKCLTIIKGLDLFGIKLSDASKKFGKRFASGASVVKGPTEKDQIDVQGDIMLDIVDFIRDTWGNIPESAIFFIEDGQKVSAAG